MGSTLGPVTDLLDRWSATVAAAGSAASPTERAEAGSALLARWSEVHRRYHTVEHLAAMLSTVDDLAADGADPVAVRLATWFHDAVYDPRRSDNEDVSAKLARSALTELAVPAALVDEVVRLVLLTSGHDPDPDDRNGVLLCDADLAILASAPSAYRRYAEAVRAEYGHVDDATFRSARAAVLRSMLARPKLFSLEFTQDKWEKRARINMAIEVSVLTGGPSGRQPLRP